MAEEGRDAVTLALEAASQRGQWLRSNVTVGTITVLQADGYLLAMVEF